MNVTTIPRKKRKQNAWSRYSTEMYYELLYAQDARCEDWAKGYKEDIKIFYSEIETKVTFKSVLISLRGSRREREKAIAA